MEVGSQTEPMDPEDILNLLHQKSVGEGRGTRLSSLDQDEIHSIDFIDGEVHFNSQNKSGLKKSGQLAGKSPSIKSKSDPSTEPSLSDKICDAVWSRKESFHSAGPSRTSSSKSKKSSKLTRSCSFSKVRKENENLMRVIQKTPPLTNVTGTNNHTQQPPPYNEIEDQDESMDNYNNNNNLIGGQSLTKSVITVDPGPGNATVDSTSPRINATTTSTTTTSASTTVNSYYEQSEDGRSKPLSSSLIGEILLNLSKPYNNGDSSKATFSLDKMMQDASFLGNSETSIKAESPDIFTEPISDGDIDENEIVRARTSIVLR